MVILALFLGYLRSEHQYFTPQNDRFSGVCARSARGSRSRRKPRNLQEYTGPSPGRPPGPGSWPRPFLRLVHTSIYAQEVNLLGSKKPLFLGGNGDYFDLIFGPKNARIYGFPGGPGSKNFTTSRTSHTVLATQIYAQEVNILVLHCRW